MTSLNETHDPKLQSWVGSANGHSDFPIQNLPFAVFRRRGSDEFWRGGVAIGDQIVDLAQVSANGQLSGVAKEAVDAAALPRLNGFMSMGPAAWSELRRALSRALREGAPQATSWRSFLVPQAEADYRVPAEVGDYTDFYTSIHHATSVGRLFRPDNPLLPNYKWVPIGYHGRSSTLGVSGQSFKRPRGQLSAPGAQMPELSPSRRMDYELELGIFIGGGNEIGEPISIDAAEEHVFGLCLLNDWSSRDIQSWEYQPLGPFLSKNFATTLSPWIVTSEALAPYRTAWKRTGDDPKPLPYLDSQANSERGALDVNLEVLIETQQMRERKAPPARMSSTSYRHAYWTFAQLVTHHTVNGCSLRPGDLFGSGTLSGPAADEAGSLLELTKGGKERVDLGDGETRIFLEDGDAVIFRGWCERQGAVRIGFGEVRGTMLPA
ncbi:MAG: fumarylacetoacetase [Burkholderiaceae bacterium]|nr:fumarylacetoacetase [Burkholderiaceae bacterium]